MEGCVQVVSGGEEALLVASEDSGICEPPHSLKLTCFSYDETHVCEHIAYPAWVRLSHNGHIRCEGGDPCKEGLHTPNLTLPSGLEGASRDGRADSLSARAILSGKSSRISTYSNACIFFTSLAGIGTKLLVNLKGVAFGLGAVLVTRLPAVVDGVTIGVVIAAEGRVGAACTAVFGIRGMSESDRGKERVGRLPEALGPGGVHDAVTQKMRDNNT